MTPFKILAGSALALFAGVTLAQPAEPAKAHESRGWYWYNEPQPIEEEELPPPAPAAPDFSTLGPTQQMEYLRQRTTEALHKAILYPSAANSAVYQRWQAFFTDKASLFSKSWEKAQLEHPELDYNLQYSHYNNAAPLQQEKDKRIAEGAIRELGQRYGLFVFYRGGEPLDVRTAEAVGAFAQAHDLALLPVHIDGIAAPSVPGSLPNAGHIEQMNIRNFPAVFLVSPTTRDFHPLAYGFISQDSLARRFLNVATDFKPNH